jgi:PAS domain S-box-containing protein
LDTLPPDSYWTTTTERIYRETLSDAFGDRLEYHYERLDAYFFPDSSYESDFEDFLLRKYQGRPIDLLLVGGIEAAAFAARLQARLAGNPPIVFQGKFDARPVLKSAGVRLEFTIKDSLDLAFRIQPETQHVFLLSGIGPVDEWYEDLFRSHGPVVPPGVDVTYLRGLPVGALVERLAALPPRSVALLVHIAADSEGRPFPITASMMERLAAASSAPIYTWNSSYVDNGAFAGRVLSAERAAEETAQLALRVLRGERPEDIPINTVENVDALDWRQLDRWGVSEARVPPGVELRFRQPSVFEKYRNYILGALAVVFLQTTLIAGLLIQRRNRRLAERSLRESEERFRVMADTAPVMIWRSGPDQRFDFFNKPWLEFRGRTLADEIGDGWTGGVHPQDLERVLSIYTSAFSRREPFRLEYRLQRMDGEYHWVLDTGVPRLRDGTFTVYIGSCIDITERRQAEEALRFNETALRQSHAEIQDLAGRLITAQEAERARIARDLHDDVNQRLAGISIAISACKRQPEMDRHPELVELLAGVQRQTIDLAEDVRLLSHDLHPGALKHVGFVDALRSHCHEFASQQGLEVAVAADDDLAIADMAVALCLYRIVQEALRNVARHACARRVRVSVRRMDDDVQLEVSDDGNGFDLARAREQGGGLGLRSIEERVRLVNGRLAIETAPNRGTAVTVTVAALASVPCELAGT